ncbi:MAG: hypothetical protein IJF88_05720 [Oscillospiraceae bacterium]|nr:hypothetical protein [Oscillospiraceae bacterium]
MGAYTCLKPARFAGVDYVPGDIVPTEAIPSNRVGSVIRLGIIAETQQAGFQANTQAPAAFGIPITIDGNTEELQVTPETVIEAVTVLQMTAEEAAKRIATTTDATALIVIDACDSRKTVKKAAAERAQTLETQAAQATAE